MFVWYVSLLPSASIQRDVCLYQPESGHGNPLLRNVTRKFVTFLLFRRVRKDVYWCKEGIASYLKQDNAVLRRSRTRWKLHAAKADECTCVWPLLGSA